MSEKARSELAVLAALAWADGEVSPEESTELRRLANQMELTSQEMSELDRLLAAPAPLDLFERLVEDLQRTHPTVEDRRTVLERAARLIRSDGKVDPAEDRHLMVLRTLLEPGAEGSFFGRVRAFVRGTRGAEPVRRDAGGGVPLTREEQERLTIGGMLAGRVLAAAAPSATDVEAESSLAEIGMSGAGAAAVLAGMRRPDNHAADRQRLCAEFNRRSGEAERLRLLRVIFALVRGHGGLTPAWEAEIRLVSNYLWIDPEEFHRVRLEMAGGRS
jgi:uncharacterized tellurite resistance protein B-like protein